MKQLFISQPMRGLTDEEILKAREEIRIRAEKNNRRACRINRFFY